MTDYAKILREYAQAENISADGRRNLLAAADENERLREVTETALEFCEFVWREVPMNEYAWEQLEKTIAVLGETND